MKHSVLAAILLVAHCCRCDTLPTVVRGPYYEEGDDEEGESAKYKGMEKIKDAKYAGMIMKKMEDAKGEEGEEGEGYYSSVMGLDDLFDRSGRRLEKQLRELQGENAGLRNDIAELKSRMTALEATAEK